MRFCIFLMILGGTFGLVKAAGAPVGWATAVAWSAGIGFAVISRPSSTRI
jgi:hypothetical protein